MLQNSMQMVLRRTVLCSVHANTRVSPLTAFLNAPVNKYRPLMQSVNIPVCIFSRVFNTTYLQGKLSNLTEQ
jgi:hypothetical protein